MYNAQIKQDEFVSLLKRKTTGVFVDIGAGTGGITGQPINFYSNTYYLESLGWSGIAIDYDKEYIDFANKNRSCYCISSDLTKDSISDILSLYDCPRHIDYLSIDVDDATINVIRSFDYRKYIADIVTMEHNLYRRDKDSLFLREYSRSLFEYNGYFLLFPDVVLDGYGPVEDWYVHSSFLSELRNKTDKQLLSKPALNCSQVIKICREFVKI
jgi:SAM-dependent methyltransferase